MFRAAAWLTKSTHAPRSKYSQSLSALDEPQELDRALKAMSLMMDDDIAGAEAFFDQGNTTFHKVGNGVIAFIRATLGFEADVIREAAETIGTAEAASEHERRDAVKHNRTVSTYPPGTEYALCGAEAQLMAAVIGILSESIVEAMKAFYKLRVAYKVLEGLHANVEEVIIRKGAENINISDSDDDEFVEVKETKEQIDHDTKTYNKPSLQRRRTYEASEILDDFIESGTSLCFGILLLFISLIPPALTRLLSILGFRGDRERGLQSLWQATKHENVHGSLATLIILNYYSGVTQFCDIVEEDPTKGGYPQKRCEDALHAAKLRHPNSLIWLIEEARMKALTDGLDESIKMLQYNTKPQMRQIEALMVFERGMSALYLHSHAEAARSFEQMIELNTWSHALYHYIAGISLLELYRENRESDPAKANAYADQGETMILKAPESLGKKRFMAKSLPLEVFVERKIRKWQTYAKERDVRLFDAIGVSPAEEMIYLWNGYKKMNNKQLTDSLTALDYRAPEKPSTRPASRESTTGSTTSSKNSSSSYPPPGWNISVHDIMDEVVVYYLLRSVVFRNLGKVDIAKELLENHVLNVDKSSIKGPNREDWPAPAARYEMAVCVWRQEGPAGVETARDWLNKSANWEAYELDARIGLRVVTALDVLKRY